VHIHNEGIQFIAYHDTGAFRLFSIKFVDVLIGKLIQ